MWKFREVHCVQGKPSATTKEILQNVVEYVRSQGIAQKEDDGRLFLRLLEFPARCGGSRVSVRHAASQLYSNRRTLARRCERAGMPSPRNILAFGRILGTLQLLRETGWTVTKAAAATGWPDPFSFSNAVFRLTGLRPTAARRLGAVAFAEAWVQVEAAEGRLTISTPAPPPCPACGRPVEAPNTPDPPRASDKAKE